VHDVDFIRWALHDEIASVYAIATSSNEEMLKNNVQDNATMMMTTTSGSLVTISMNRHSVYGYDQRCEIFGDCGKVTIGNEFNSTTTVSDCLGEHWPRLKNSYNVRFRDAFSNELNAFADTVLQNDPWPIERDDVISVQRVAAAAKRSFETKQIVYL